MSDLIDLLSDLALLESTPSDMNQGAMSLIFNVKKQLDDFCAELTMSTNLAAALHHDDGYSTVGTPKLLQLTPGTTNLIQDHHQDSLHCGDFGSLSQSTGSNFDSMHAPSLQVNSGLEVPALSKSSEFRSGAMDTNRMQANSNENETHSGSRFEIMNGDHIVINALNQGLPTPQSTDNPLERLAGTGPYYLSANNSSTSSPTSAGLSTIQLAMRGTATHNKSVFPGASDRTFGANLVSDIAMSTRRTEPSNSDLAIRGNATQMKRALSEASSRIAAGGAQKKAKGDMDPVGVPQPQLFSF